MNVVNLINTVIARLKRIFIVNFVFEVFTRFGRDNGGLLAAGLAFFLVLALVPLLLVALWGLGLVYAHKPDEAVAQIKDLLASRVLPGAANTEVVKFMTQAHISDGNGHAGPTLLNIINGHGVAGLIAFLAVVWAAIQIFINGSTAMNAAWETKETRNWFVLRGVALGLLVGAGLLLAFSLAVTALSTAISANPLAQMIPFESAIKSGAVELAAVVVSGLMYAVIYKFLPSPSANVSWKSALIGGAAAAIAFEIAKKGLSVLLLSPKKSLYGDLGNLIAFVLWIYYSMMILLLGAEVSAVYAADIEQKTPTRLKRAAQATPAADASSSSGSPLARSKQRDRAQRVRKTGQKEGR
ncbi:MAG: YihY/virulence factor BrkB family protein [Janthinobacterium lividum]